MKIAVLGASGWIGNHIVKEAKSRGHEVVALVRDVDKCDDTNIEVRQFDLLDSNADLVRAVKGVDVVISAIGGRAAGNHEIVKNTAQKLLSELPQAGIYRLLWVGGAGALEVSPGVQLMTIPEFPAEYVPESIALAEAFDVFCNTNSTLNWTFIAPAADIFPGEKQAPYRIGGEQLLVDEKGNCRISVSDYAVAMIDELEAGKYPNQRIAVAY
ncbi:NAD(P)-dependent oxidoreductase [Photobacterium iliopiscarium]|uniref:NAD(P)-dependent oxidoreductase n=1 Tax=Photobacterium iliopiscarium TaxID=56192 RepID=UPI001E3798C5|nr:NAD(P)-dependent oxidoreductase [Photobacterium iliopiscarium]MCD9468056.1 NAD-dependent dehydratase [Photobacterium iliopiscarium]MCD9487899.1 NAD(P)H-binding protein [Photobacterium iliopiscarium]MCF2244611.1 NAD(P)H-binding protein [Photobacterium iliopiscarium]